MFAIEGLLTGLIGIVSWLYLPASPYQTASRFRGSGWFTEHEEKIMANRILRDDPGKGDMHNRQGLSWGALRASISDYHMWPLYLLGLTWNVPTVPMQGYITLNLKAVGFGTFETNLLSIPAFVLFILGLIVSLCLCSIHGREQFRLTGPGQFWTFLSERINERFLLATVSQWWALIMLIALVALPSSRSPWAQYALSVLLYGMPYVQAIFTALTSRNAGSVRTRTVATALYNIFYQVSNVIGINVSQYHVR